MAFIHSPKLVANGLVLYLDAGNRKSYISGSTAWKDLSGTTVTGSITNGPTFDGNNCGTIGFDGVNDYTNFGNILNVGLNSWTISCWVKINSGTGTIGIFGKTSARSYVGRYAFYIDSNNINGLLQANASSNYIVSTAVSPYLDSKFHNLALTMNRTGLMTFYIDTVSVGTPVNISADSSANLNASTDFLYVGSYADATGQSPAFFLNGSISSVQIYNRALSAAEVLQNYNATRGRFGL